MISEAEKRQQNELNADSSLNPNLELYTKAIKEVAEKRGVVFADVFAPTRADWIARVKYQEVNDAARDAHRAPSYGVEATSDGVHLNPHGDLVFAFALDSAVFGKWTGRELFADDVISIDHDGIIKPSYRSFNRAIADKNLHWYHRYRIVDSYYVYGGRADLKFADGEQTNRDVMQREREVLDVMVANRDQRIWDLAQHKAVPEKVDDSNVPPFLPVKTFFGVGKKTDAGQNTGMTSKTAEADEIKFLTPEEEKKTFKLAPGYEASCFADERQFPDLGNAVAMAFDTRGRLWVSTFQSYPQWQPGGPMNDKILILEDNDHDGKADEQITFAEGLHLPISFQFYNGGILVSHQREMLFLKDTNNDDKADIREQVLDGFDSADSHHVINTFTYGPGGDLYFQEGTFQTSQIETPYGPVRCVDAGTYRYEPRTQRLEVFASYKYANPHGIAFDRWGQTFISDASGGANYFGTAFSGYLPYPEKHSTMQQWFPKRVRPTSGCEFVSSRHFPDEAQGRFLLANCIGVQGILQHEVKEVGSGFEGKEIEPLLLSTDPMFRPVAMTFAPDGSLYVIDWCEALIGHMQYSIRDPLRDKTHGRIWRITYPSRPLVVDPKIAGESVEKLVALLGTHEDRTRERVKQELSTRPWEEVEGALSKKSVEYSLIGLQANSDHATPAEIAAGEAIKAESDRYRLEMLWVYQWNNQPNELLLKLVLLCPEPHARAAATRVLCAWRDRIPNALKLLLDAAKDNHPRVRLEAVRAVSWFAESAVRNLGVASATTEKVLPTEKKDVLNEKKLTPRDIEVAPTEKKVALTEQKVTPKEKEVPPTEQKGAPNQQKVSLTENKPTAAEPSPAGLKPMTTLADVALAVLDYPMDYYLDYTLNETMRVVDVDVKSLKNPKALAFVVNRLTNDELAAAPDIEPIFAARLARKGFDPVKREAALTALMELRKQDRVTVITDAINKLDTQGATAQAAVIELGRILLASGPALKPQRPLLYTMSRNAISQSFTREIAYAAVALADGAPEEIWKATDDDVATRTMLLNAIPLIPDPALRAAFQPSVIALFNNDKQHQRIRTAALKALPALGAQHAAAGFTVLVAHLKQEPFFDTAVGTLLQMPKESWDKTAASALAQLILDRCAKVPTDQRTDDAYLEAMQLGNDLAALMPDGDRIKKQLRALGVSTIILKTLREQMIYDKLTFEVEAGKPVAIILENTDIMPHNFVIVQPGALEEVAMKSQTMPPVPDKLGRLYIPESDKILAATKMLEPGQREKITWIAPSTPGKVPFVCTFPGHWVRMKGEIEVK